MRTVQIFRCLILSLCVMYQAGQASSLNGTVNLVYASAPQVFHNGDAITGFVRINNGFSLVPAASVLFDTFITVSGGIDLKSTGILNLNNDMRLDAGVTLTTGGIISGRDHAVILGGDLTLTSTNNVRALTVRSNTVFDGEGKTFIIGDRAQIFVETNVTVTLRNLVLKTGKFSQTPPIRLASLGSKLALDNVIVALGSDFDFRQGQMFIHNDVTFSGTSAFIYRSPRPSYIASGGLLMFDQGTTFSMTPASFTDAPFTANPITITNNFLVMKDASSSLFFNGSSLSTTYTGLCLTKGNLFFDNRVVLNSAASTDISAVTSLGAVATALLPRAVSWSPDGRFLGVVSNTGNSFQIYRFNGTGTPVLIGSAATGLAPLAVAWSPNGRFIAVLNSTDSTAQIYTFNGNSAPTTVGGAVSTGLAPQGLAWSPDGRFFVVVNSTSLSIQVYRFDGVNTPTTVGGTALTGLVPSWVSWSPDGRFLAVLNSTSLTLQIYSFDGSNTPTTVGGVVATGMLPLQVEWSPDGRFLAVINSTFATLQIYSFDGVNTPVTVGGAILTGSVAKSLTWSPDGRFIAVVNGTSSNLQIFSFDGSSTPVAVGTPVTTGTTPLSVVWSPHGGFIAVANSVANTLEVFRVDYGLGTTSPQALSQSIVFGNHTQGAGANLNVRFLGGAHVEVYGKVRDDSA